MANTYTQIHIQVVFSVQNRQSLVSDLWKAELYKYITGIIQSKQHKLLAINGMPDHLHIFFGLRPIQSVSSIIQDIKTNSSKWINDRNFVNGYFSWQEGFGAFSYRKSDINQIINYILNQEDHHKKKSFIDEYTELLKEFSIDFDSRYIFKPI